MLWALYCFSVFHIAIFQQSNLGFLPANVEHEWTGDYRIVKPIHSDKSCLGCDRDGGSNDPTTALTVHSATELQAVVAGSGTCFGSATSPGPAVQIIAFLERILSCFIWVGLFVCLHTEPLLSILHWAKTNDSVRNCRILLGLAELCSVWFTYLHLWWNLPNNIYLLYSVWLIPPGKQFHWQMNARSGLVNTDENLQLVFCILLLMDRLIRKFVSTNNLPVSSTVTGVLEKWSKWCFYNSTDMLSAK